MAADLALDRHASFWWRPGAYVPPRCTSMAPVPRTMMLRFPSEAPEDNSLARLLWQEHIRDEKRRVQELAAQRRLNPPEDPPDPALAEKDRLASERVLSDYTLERGDIVVTDKGAFVFKGQTLEQRTLGDFEPLAGYPVRR
jgi:hypothetical protein